MATYKKDGDLWRVQVARKGIRKSATFNTKAKAVAWATQLEADIITGKLDPESRYTFGDVLTRYASEVSPKKDGAKWEINRLNLISRDPVSKIRLSELSNTHVAEWRDRRLKDVKPASVRREWTLLSHALTIAIKEWEWVKTNPFKDVDKPTEPEPRNRRISDDEIERLLFATGYHDNFPETVTSRVGAALLFAIETAMRAGEIIGMTWGNVDPIKRYVHLPKTKNGSKRDVPLSSAAIELIEQLRDFDPVFGLSSKQLDVLFRKAKERALIEDLHFHDTRREALTRLSKKFNVMELAKISGHRDLRILQSVYYAPNIEDLASKLD